MRCYRYYKIPTDVEENYIESKMGDESHIEDRYVLYAITNDKETAKQFKLTRNMKRFIEVKSKMEPEEYRLFANRNRSTVLQEHELLTVKNKYDDNQEVYYISMIMTMNEIQYIVDVVDDSGILYGETELLDPVMTFANPIFYNNKCRRALSDLGFTQLYYLYRSIAYNDPNVLAEMGEDPEYDIPSFTLDEFAVFMTGFSDLMA